MSFLKNRPSGAERLLLLLLIPALLVPSAASARDRVRVTPKVRVSEEYQSNATRSEFHDESDFVTRFEPSVVVESAGETGHTRLELALPARVYERFSEFNTVDQKLKLDMDRALTQRLRVFATARFENYDDSDPVEVDGIELSSGNLTDEMQISLSGGFRYQLTPRTSGIVSLGLTGVDYDGASRDQEIGFASATLEHALGPRDTVQLSATAQTLAFDDAQSASFLFRGFDTVFGPIALPVGFIATSTQAQDDLISVIQATWNRTWSPRWTSNLRIGVRRLVSDGAEQSFQGTQVSSGSSETSYGFVGGLTLQRRLMRGMLTLGVDQETRPSSGLGASLDVRTLHAAFERQLAPRWNLTARAIWRDFESAQDAERLFAVGGGLSAFRACQAFGGTLRGANGGPSLVCARSDAAGVDSRTLSGNVTLRWLMRSSSRGNLTSFFAYDILRQASDGTSFTNTFTDHRFRIGFDYAWGVDVP